MSLESNNAAMQVAPVQKVVPITPQTTAAPKPLFDHPGDDDTFLEPQEVLLYINPALMRIVA